MRARVYNTGNMFRCGNYARLMPFTWSTRERERKRERVREREGVRERERERERMGV